MSGLARMMANCLTIRAALPNEELRDRFDEVSEAALRHQAQEDMRRPIFQCNPDESGGLAEVFAFDEARRG